MLFFFFWGEISISNRSRKISHITRKNCPLTIVFIFSSKRVYWLRRVRRIIHRVVIQRKERELFIRNVDWIGYNKIQLRIDNPITLHCHKHFHKASEVDFTISIISFQPGLHRLMMVSKSLVYFSFFPEELCLI